MNSYFVRVYKWVNTMFVYGSEIAQKHRTIRSDDEDVGEVKGAINCYKDLQRLENPIFINVTATIS